jgi:hypothetical protein
VISEFRRVIRRVGRDLAPLSLSLVTLAVVGLGVRLADQWHRHGGSEGGFTHLHVLVGAHQHDGRDEHRHRDCEPVVPDEPAPPDDRESNGVLTFTVGAVSAPLTPSVVRPTAMLGKRRADGFVAIVGARLENEPWSPRAPPA